MPRCCPPQRLRTARAELRPSPEEREGRERDDDARSAREAVEGVSVTTDERCPTSTAPDRSEQRGERQAGTLSRDARTALGSPHRREVQDLDVTTYEIKC
jgi:hypothetical protein